MTMRRSSDQNDFSIRSDDPGAAASLLRDHLEEMQRVSPPESRHALDIEGLRASDISFWTIWHADTLVGCGALRELSPRAGEIKSMKTAGAWLRRGVATAMLDFMLAEARGRSYKQLFLETGSMAHFSPARALYQRFGFKPRGPFGDYPADENSVFMSCSLSS